MIIPGWLEEDRTRILLLMIFAAFLYLPVGFTDYLYTDEAVQLWNYRPGGGFRMFSQQGRFLNDLLFQWLFGAADHIRDLRWLRGFSLAGWLLMIPVWYRIITAIAVREALPARFTPLLMVALICSPTVCISVNWAACLELFIAYTSGLAAGWFAYRLVRDGSAAPRYFFPLALLFALVCLFTYQNGIGFFLFPFLMIVLGRKGGWRPVAFGVLAFFSALVIYFILFKLQQQAQGFGLNERAGFTDHPLQKIKFFLAVTVGSAFRFGLLVNEKSRIAMGISAGVILLVGYSVYRYFKRTGRPWPWTRVIQIVFLIVLCYLPSLMVRENYASNRTQLAVNLFVFSCTLVTLFRILKSGFGRAVLVLSVLSWYLIVAVYQYHFLFRTPVVTEYLAWKTESNRVRDSNSPVLLERPAEDRFVRHYHIIRSWDEFGVPSMHFSWVPPFYLRQLLYERTGDRASADRLQVRSYLEGDAAPALIPGEVFLRLSSNAK